MAGGTLRRVFTVIFRPQDVVPELAGRVPDERARLWGKARSQYARRWTVLLVDGSLIPCVLACLLLAGDWRIAGGLAALFVWWGATEPVRRRMIRSHVRASLEEQACGLPGPNDEATWPPPPSGAGA